MKKRGFTLIELLAVIVILALIALIAVPIIMDIIEESRKGAAERGAENYMKAVETVVIKEVRYGNDLEGKYIIQSDASLCKEDDIGCDNPIKINMSGNKPSSGIIVIENGVVTTASTVGIGDYIVRYDHEQKMYIASKDGETSEEENTVVYRYVVDNAVIIRVGDTIDPNDTTKFVTDPTTLDQNFYVKHELDKDNKVTETWACAVFGGEETCLKGGGAEAEANYAYNVSILQNLKDKNIEGVSCTLKDIGDIGSIQSGCYDSSVSLTAFFNQTPSVWVQSSDLYCVIWSGSDKSARCDVE